MPTARLSVILALILPGIVIAAESSADSSNLPVLQMETVVVVAERVPLRLRQIAAATNVVTLEAIRASSAQTLAEAVALSPGMMFVDKDGSGVNPMGITRGYFGGGETDYILLSVDGVPANDQWSGSADWRVVPLSSVERIEVLRGQGSAQYGDAALAAVVNVVTEPPTQSSGGDACLSIGDNGATGVSFGLNQIVGNNLLSVDLVRQRGDGFRDHSNWQNSSFRFANRYSSRKQLELSFNGSYRRSLNDAPGPLSLEQIDANRKQSDPAFSADYQKVDQIDLNIGFNLGYWSTAHLRADCRLSSTEREGIETLRLSPQFVDSQRFKHSGTVFWSFLRSDFQSNNVDWLVGSEIEVGKYNGGYSAIGSQLESASDGNGKRLKTAVFSDARLKVGTLATLFTGLRFDAISSDFHNHLGGELGKSEFNQVSPRLGINVRYLNHRSFDGNFYVNWTTAFKAPSLKQLFDQRAIPIGPPGSSISFSNTNLRPQRSQGWDAGFYQRLTLFHNLVISEFSVAVYSIDLEDEIDFDLSILKYGNILSSRHSGIEIGARVYLLPRVVCNSTYNQTRSVFEGGSFDGKSLKNIPSHTYRNDLSIDIGANAQIIAVHSMIGGSFLDDNNGSELAGSHIFDFTVRCDMRRISIHAFVKNLFNTSYSATGYMLFDPVAESDQIYVYPGAGRTIGGGVDLSIW